MHGNKQNGADFKVKVKVLCVVSIIFLPFFSSRLLFSIQQKKKKNKGGYHGLLKLLGPRVQYHLLIYIIHLPSKPKYLSKP